MKKKLITSICTLILSFSMVIGSAFAWFSMNLNSTSNAFNIQIQEPNLDVSTTIYKYNSNTNTIGIVDNLTLNKYDSVIEENNFYTALIIAFVLSGNAIESECDLHFSIQCTSEDIEEFCLSNVTKFGILQISEINDASLFYTSTLESVSEYKTFIQNNEKKSTVDFTVESSTYLSLVNNNQIMMALVVDYDDELITTLNNDESYIDVDDFSNVITFTSDITKVVIY